MLRRILAVIWISCLLHACVSRAAPEDVSSGDAASEGVAPEDLRPRKKEHAEFENLVVASPDGRLQLEITLETGGAPSWSLTVGGTKLLEKSAMGLELSGGESLARGLRITKISRREISERYKVPFGKSSRANAQGREQVITLESVTSSRVMEIACRAYDEGVAFRYRVLAREKKDNIAVTSEVTEFHIPADSVVTSLPLGSFTTSYETRYVRGPATSLMPGQLIGLPLLVEPKGGGALALTEAALRDSGGLYLARADDSVQSSHLVLDSRLSPRIDRPELKVDAQLPWHSPWRVVMVGTEIARLLESNLLLHLNEPSVVEDTSWIRPGKVHFMWWNGYVEPGASFSPGLNTQTLIHSIDFCARNGIEFYSLDGVHGRAWYGGKIAPYEGGEDLTTAVPEIDLEKVIAHGRKLGVGLRIWVHWRALDEQMDRVLPVWSEWGVEGIMVDFMNRDEQPMVDFYHRVLEATARHRMTVNFHGAYKPTGIRRTYPNLLTREAALNIEYDKWDARGCTPDHEISVACIRMIAGPIDFHQGCFRPVAQAEFRPRNAAPRCIGTMARQLAMYVVLENPLPMLVDYVGAYEAQPEALEFVRDVPTVWDETRVLVARPGEFIAIARRHGASWYLGAWTDGTARALDADLEFLGTGDWTAEFWADEMGEQAKPEDVLRERRVVSTTSRLKVPLSAAGGVVIRIEHAK